MDKATVSLQLLFLICAIVSALSALSSMLFTNWFNVRKMRKQYAPLSFNGSGYITHTEARVCMQGRENSERQIIKVLRRMEKRMCLGNIVIRDLVETVPDIPNDKIERYEKDLGISLNDRNFGIPDV